jgi:hypothetical protein
MYRYFGKIMSRTAYLKSHKILIEPVAVRHARGAERDTIRK